MSTEPSSEFEAFACEYQQAFIAAIQGWDLGALGRIAEVLREARRNDRTVLLCGNGGSAAVANHAECDATKGTHVEGGAVLNTRSLAANTSMLTALGNDLGYASVFEKQVEYFARPGDVVLIVSSGGSSPNVVAACKAAKARGLTTIALVGFSGGELKGLADHVLHVPVHNYGIVEDLHQASIHLITQFLRAVWTHEAKAGR